MFIYILCSNDSTRSTTLGLLHPRGSTNSVPPAVTSPATNSRGTTGQRGNRVRRSESMGRVESDRRRAQRVGTLHPNDTRQPLLTQSQEYHNYSSHYQTHSKASPTTAGHYQAVRPERTLAGSNKASPLMSATGLEMGTLTLTNHRTGSHLVNGKLYTAKPGHIINSNGQVVNLTDGEVMSLAQAERVGIVKRMTDKDPQAGQSYVPASNMMFNRVSS